jgi:hypothetical protein
MSRTAIADPSAFNRSRVSNGSRAFMAADGRSRGARLLRDREREFAEPFGGLAVLSVTDRRHVEAAAILSVRLEAVRCGLARGEPGIADDALVRLTNGLARALSALQKHTPPKPKGPTLAEYLAAKAAAA